MLKLIKMYNDLNDKVNKLFEYTEIKWDFNNWNSLMEIVNKIISNPLTHESYGKTVKFFETQYLLTERKLTKTLIMTADQLVTLNILKLEYPNNTIVLFKGKFYLI